jgi:hypothetical protein
MGVADGQDASEPLGISMENHVEICPDVMGSNLDEMSFDFFKSIPCWYANVQWSYSQGTGTNLVNYNINPVLFQGNVSDGSVTLVNVSPIAFIGNMHNLWRGSIMIRVRMAKTQFHSGRLLVGANYYDADLAASIVPTVTQSAYTYRHIIDVREIDEFEVCVPYIRKTPWCTTKNTDNPVTFYISVLDPLVAPANVSQTFNLVIEVFGGPDLQYASPRSQSYTPTIPSALQMDASKCIRTNTCIGGTSIVDSYIDAVSVTQGEACTSWRQRLKRLGPWTVGPTDGVLTNTYVMAPFSNYWGTSNGSTFTGTNTAVSLDVYSLLSSIYANARGGVRLTYLPNGISGSQRYFVTLDHANSGAGSIGTIFQSAAASFANFLWNATTQPLGTFSGADVGSYQIPQNSQTLHRISLYNYMVSGFAMAYTQKLYPDPAQVTITQLGGTDDQVYVLRAGADDCSFHTFVSIPPLYQITPPA